MAPAHLLVRFLLAVLGHDQYYRSALDRPLSVGALAEVPIWLLPFTTSLAWAVSWTLREMLL